MSRSARRLGRDQERFESVIPTSRYSLLTCRSPSCLAKRSRWRPVHKSPANSCIDNPDVLRVAKAGALNGYQRRCLEISDLAGHPIRGPKSPLAMARSMVSIRQQTGLAISITRRCFLTPASVNPPATWAELTDDAQNSPKLQCTDWTSLQVNTEEATWQWEPFLWSNGGSYLI